jgi:sec-independent protein translocase protein TatC
MMFMTFGLVMQFPIVLVILAKAGIVSVDRLRRGRRYALLGLFILAVVVTPQDPFSSVLMTTVLYPVYEATIFIVGRSQRRAEPVESDG